MQNEIPSQWGILELMGRKVVAGLISDVGKPLVRIDVPTTKAFDAFTQMYGINSIYAITFTSEEVARATAEDIRTNPISIYAPSLVKKEEYDELEDKYRESILRLEGPKKSVPDICPNSGRPKSECSCDDCIPF